MIGSITSATSWIKNTDSSKRDDDIKKKLDRAASFEQALKDFDAAQETEEQRYRRRAAEDKEADSRREKQKKITELQGRIAALRSKALSARSHYVPLFHTDIRGIVWPTY